MKKKNVKKSGMSTGKKVAVGAGLAVLGAGAYYLLGPDGKKNQKKVKVWAVKMEKEVVKKIKQVKKISKPVYHNIIDTLSKSYSKEYKEYAPEIQAFSKQLKTKWKATEKKSKPVIKKTKRTVKKITTKKKATKK